MEFRPARRLSEIVRAWEIVHDAYVRAGLILPAATGLFLHREQARGRGCVAVAIDGGEMVATAGGILDGEAGLPLDRQFPEILAQLRTRHVLVECGTIAAVAHPGDPVAIAGVIAVLLSWARSAGATAVLTSCNRRHAAFYRRAYGLRQVGPVRSYDALAGAEVVMLLGTYAEMLRLHRGRKGVRSWLESEVDLAGLMEPARIREIA